LKSAAANRRERLVAPRLFLFAEDPFFLRHVAKNPDGFSVGVVFSRDLRPRNSEEASAGGIVERPFQFCSGTFGGRFRQEPVDHRRQGHALFKQPRRIEQQQPAGFRIDDS